MAAKRSIELQRDFDGMGMGKCEIRVDEFTRGKRVLAEGRIVDGCAVSGRGRIGTGGGLENMALYWKWKWEVGFGYSYNDVKR